MRADLIVHLSKITGYWACTFSSKRHVLTEAYLLQQFVLQMWFQTEIMLRDSLIQQTLGHFFPYFLHP